MSRRSQELILDFLIGPESQPQGIDEDTMAPYGEAACGRIFRDDV
jgi:hypothetical protein